MKIIDGYYFIRLRKDVLIQANQPNKPSYILPKNSIQLAAVARFKSDSIATPMFGAIVRNPANLQPTRPAQPNTHPSRDKSKGFGRRRF